MAELWDLVDKHKNKTGLVWKRGDSRAIPKGMYHICTVIWTVRPDGKILLTKRHPSKPYGLLWENSGGSLLSGENGREGAKRELYEETGISAEVNDFIYLGDSISSDYIAETYLYHIPACDVELKLQASEVVDAKWVTPAELEDMRSQIVPTIYKKYLRYKKKIIGSHATAR